MNPRTGRILVSAFFILAFSIFNFATYTSTTSLQSTFALQPGLAYYLSTTRNPSDMISGQFQENASMLVSFYILSSAQFAAHQANISFTDLYALTNVASGTISFTVTIQDTYYLFFDHGSGVRNVAEIVNFQRSYTTHDNNRLLLGTLFLGLALADFYYAFRSNKKERLARPPPTVPWPGTQLQRVRDDY